MVSRCLRWLLSLGFVIGVAWLALSSPVEFATTLSPPAIQLDGADIVLQWPTDPAYSHYDVYRSTTPYFTPDGRTLLAWSSGASYRDRCVAGDVGTNYTYVIRAVRPDDSYDDLPAVGAFSFWLAPPWPTPATLYVDQASGADAGRCADPAHPCATIGYALCRAWRGDTIQVAQGSYAETLSINKAVTLRGGYEPLGWSRCLANCTTEIRGDGAHPVVSVVTTQAERATLDGFTITGGNSGVSVRFSTLDVANTVLTNNHALDAGGGMHIDHAIVTITNSLIHSNTAAGISGALHIISTWAFPPPQSEVYIVNSTIVSNTAPNTNGIFNSLSWTSATNSILWGHAGQDFGGHMYSATYTDIEMDLAGEGNIHEEPRFADPAHDDFHLLAESPCIDAGSNTYAPAADFEGEPRPADGNGDGVAQADMGADELVPGYADGWRFPLDYGPYRAGQAPGGSTPSPQQIGQDMF